ncbi:MAG: hypothetical protein OCU18_03915 [Candidatus Syntrophoarchaeum sp.]|nr:hypothetical protein [Candidatus Syntrophoarchaeum sp.]
MPFPVPKSINLPKELDSWQKAVTIIEQAYRDIAESLGNILFGKLAWEPGTISDGSGVTSGGIAVDGAAFSDYVMVAPPYSLQGIICTGYISAADTVKIRLQNETGSGITLGNGTWKVMVTK